MPALSAAVCTRNLNLGLAVQPVNATINNIQLPPPPAGQHVRAVFVQPLNAAGNPLLAVSVISFTDVSMNLQVQRVDASATWNVNVQIMIQVVYTG